MGNELGWRWGLLAAAAVTLISLFPQIHLWLERGTEWRGAYSVMHPDELMYSAYVRALIDGRPRKNDPFTGLYDPPGEPQTESHLSIQFVPPYAVALPARLCAASAASAFIGLRALAAFASSLALFWLIVAALGDGRIAAAAVVCTLFLGTFVGHQGMGWALLGTDVSFLYFPFLRCYPVAAAFPLFIVYCALVWRALAAETARSALVNAALAGLLFGLLVFSYFYLWTAAAAWTACLSALWMLAHPGRWGAAAARLAVLGLIGCAALTPYALLLSRRAVTVDATQTVTLTRAPDLFRVPELVGAAVIAAVALGAWRGRINLREGQTLLALSFALLPFSVFNQQIITGRSMQPFHYELFIANYAVLVGAAVALGSLWPARGREGPVKRGRVVCLIALGAVLWGIFEVVAPAVLMHGFNEAFDRAVPVALRLKELARVDGSGTRGKYRPSAPPAAVLSTDIKAGMLIPTFAPQAALWTPFDLVFPNVTAADYRERFYAYLYYSGLGGGELRRALSRASDRNDLNRYSAFSIFGHERVHEYLGGDFRPLTEQEVEAAVREFEQYAATFSRDRAARHALSYLVVPRGARPDLSNIDRWYERGPGESHGDFELYKLRLRD